MRFEDRINTKLVEIESQFIREIEIHFLGDDIPETTSEQLEKVLLEIFEAGRVMIEDPPKICRRCRIEQSENVFLPKAHGHQVRYSEVCLNCLELTRFANRVRIAIRMGLARKGYLKKSRTTDILGCNFLQFRAYIEDLFTSGMGWDNMHAWHLDHKIPISTARNESDVLRLNHYSNFQPLWGIDNIKKGSKLLPEYVNTY